MEIDKMDRTFEKIQRVEPSDEPSFGSGQQWLSLTEASQLLPRFNNRRISITTLWRWAVYGYHGVYLDHLRMGRRLVVTMAGLNQFFTEVAKLDADVHGPANSKPKRRKKYRHTDPQRQRELDKAREILVRAKILQETAKL